MKKNSVIIIAVVSGLIVLAGVAAAGVAVAKRLLPIVERDPENGAAEVERTMEQALSELAERHNALDWGNGLATNYSYEVKADAVNLKGQAIVFTAALYDILKTDDGYAAIFHDRGLTEAPFSIGYRLKCSEEQLGGLSERRNEEEVYAIYAVAARIDSAAEVLSETSEIWSRPLLLEGELLEYERILLSDLYDYY